MAGGRSTTLTVRIAGDAKPLRSELGSAESGIDRFERRMGSASKVAAGALVAAAAVGKELYDSASALQQSAGAVESVFGKQAAAVQKLAASAAQGVGLSANEYQELAAVLGSQLKNMGIAQDKLAGSSDALIQKGADLAATFGGTTSDAVAALSSLLRGETDPIERYGVSIKAADIAAQRAAMGTDKLTGAQGRAAQTAALMALLEKQTGAATGAFGREADTAAGQTQRASASFENAKAALGEALLPVVSIAAQMFASLSAFVTQNTGAVQIGAVAFIALAATVIAINAAVKAARAVMAAYQAIMVAVRIAQFAWNVALAANPLGLVVVAIAAVIAVAVLLYNKFEPIRVVVGKVRDWFEDAFGWVIDNVLTPVVDVLQFIFEKIAAVGAFLSDIGSVVNNLFGGGGTVTVQGAGLAGSPAGLAGAAVSPELMGATGYSGLFLNRRAFSRPAPREVERRECKHIEFHITGAVDRVGTARQIRRVLTDFDVTRGQSHTLDLGVRRR